MPPTLRTVLGHQGAPPWAGWMRSTVSLSVTACGLASASIARCAVATVLRPQRLGRSRECSGEACPAAQPRARTTLRPGANSAPSSRLQSLSLRRGPARTAACTRLSTQPVVREDVRDGRPGGARVHGEPLADLLVRPALHQEPQHLLLPLRKRHRHALGALLALAHPPQQHRADARREERLAPGHRGDAGHDLLDGPVLEEVAARSGAQGGRHIGFARRHRSGRARGAAGSHEVSRRVTSAPDSPGIFRSTTTTSGPVRVHGLQRRPAVAGLGDHVDPGLGEELREARPVAGMVVCDDHSVTRHARTVPPGMSEP